ncbi:HipA domain-containing protein [Halopseudomonas pachastrellae]|nr:HipA domain-containing protein [Halopseudomonas pachastrellae]
MSEDGKVLVVDRFDVDQHGEPCYGVEDACGLLGLPPHEKYSPSIERVWKATRAYIPNNQARAQSEHFGCSCWQTMSCVMGLPLEEHRTVLQLACGCRLHSSL